MRIVFMGTPSFAAASLERLLGGKHTVTGVFSQPDRKKDRGMKVSLTPVKELALNHGVEVFQPSSLRDGEAITILKDLKPDLIAVVAYGKLLPREILDLPKFGCINIHGSLLPKYRGAAPVQWSVINGDKITGVTSMHMAEQMDAGDILLQRETEIEDGETAVALYARLSLMGAELLCDTIDALESGRAVSTKQEEGLVTFAPPLTKDMSLIDWTRSAFEISCLIRGLQPWPVAAANIDGTLLKIYSASHDVRETKRAPGEIISADAAGIKIACGMGSLLITEVQAPGKKRMSAAEYLRGHPICL